MDPSELSKDLQNQIAKIKEEIQTTRNSISEAESRNAADAKAEASAIEEIGSLNAEMFSLQVANDTKRQKIQMLSSINESIGPLTAEKDQLLKQISEKEAKISQKDGNQEYGVLYDRLQSIRLDPSQQTLSTLIEQKKKLMAAQKKLKNQRQQLQAKMEGQQGVAILEERKAFMQKIAEENVLRAQRLELSLSLQKRKMRCDTFQREVRGFV